jgi:hypothetical protein
MCIVVTARQSAADLHRLRASGKDRHTIPGFLAVPDRSVTCRLDRERGKLVVGSLEFLEARDVGLFTLKPRQQVRQPGTDAVYVKSGDLHQVFRMVAEPISYGGRTQLEN